MTYEETLHAFIHKGPDCPMCYGTGHVTSYNYTAGLDAYQSDRSTCLQCGGFGTVLDPFAAAVVEALETGATP